MRTVLATCRDCPWTEPESGRPADGTDGVHRGIAGFAKRHMQDNKGHRVLVTLTVTTEYAGGRAPRQPYRGRRGDA